MKLVAAMSGGVDSAVACARAVAAGHDVTAVHMALNRAAGTLRQGSRGCCTIEDAMDARRAAAKIGVPFYVWDLSERFHDEVVADFINEYAAGRTPNPCMRCNEKIKFQALLKKAVSLGFDGIVTGHYARVHNGPEGPRLLRARERAKDQSYVLAVLNGEELARCVFPLGETESKKEVRAEAERLGLGVHEKPDSYDICFIPEGDTRDWLHEHISQEPGAIVDESGVRLGTHDGARGYTIGQRRGLGLKVAPPDGKPRYVLAIRPVSNEVVVGSAAGLLVDTMLGARYSVAGDPGFSLLNPFTCLVQVRAHGEAVPATAVLREIPFDERESGEACRPGASHEFSVRLSCGQSLQGVAPGQTCAIYVGEAVVAQFTIDRAFNSVTAGVSA